MARYYDWSPAGYSTDPIPGDPQVLRDEATKFASVAESITEAATNLRNIANTGDASGEFVEEFATQAKEVADRISKAEIKYTGLADALREYAGPLEQFQTDSVAILNRAINANANAKDGAKWEQHWTQELLQPDVTPEQAIDIQKKLDAATTDRVDGESGAISARLELEQLGFDRDTAASTAANKIKQAGEDSGINDSGWDNWVQFWEENGEWIDEVVKIIGIVASILAVVAMFIPGLNVIVAGIIGAIVIASMVLTVVNAIAQASAGTKSVGDAIVDVALALIPFGAGKVIGAVGKAGVAGATEVAVTARAADMAVDGAGAVTRSTAAADVASELARVAPNKIAEMVSSNPLLIAQLEKLRNIAGSGSLGNVVLDNPWLLKDLPLLQGVVGAGEAVGFSVGDPIKDLVPDDGWLGKQKSEMSW